MPNVWYTGGGSRTITSEDWDEHGITADTVTWNALNAWSIDETEFTAPQLAILDADNDFLLGQTGPRAFPRPVSPVEEHQSGYVYYARLLEIYEHLIALAGGDYGYLGSFGHTFSVLNYGAIGDGIADDTQAIQDTIDASSSGSVMHGPVIIPAGRYKVTSSITLKSKILVYGQGESTYIDFSNPTSSTDTLFEYYGSSIYDVTINSMKMVGNGSNLANNSNCTAIYLWGTSSVARPRFNDVIIQNFQTGIYVRSEGYVDQPLVQDSLFRGCSYAAINYKGTVDGTIVNNTVDCSRVGVGDGLAGIVGIWASAPNTDGLDSYNTNLTIHANHVMDARYEGINTMGRFLNITGNNVRDCVQTGMLIEPAVRADPTEDEAKAFSTISGNVVIGSQYNITVRRDPVNNFREVGQTAITGNTTSGGDYGIVVGFGFEPFPENKISGPKEVAVSGNTCVDHAKRGIVFNGVERCTADGNVAEGVDGGLSISYISKLVTVTGGAYTCTGTDSDGISISGDTKYVTITGAVVHNVGRSAVRISGNADYIVMTGLIALDDRETPLMDQAVMVTGTGTHIYVDGNSMAFGTTHPEGAFQGITSLNSTGAESANAETPTAAKWKVGDIVKFTDTGDGSGNGIYILGPNGVTWSKLADLSLIHLIIADVGLNWWPSENYLSGHYYVCNSPVDTFASNQLGNNSLRVSPWVVPYTITVDKLWLEHVSPGDSGAVFRVVVYADDAGEPGDLMHDLGTVPIDGAGQVHEISISQTFAPGLYWVGGVVQGSPVVQPFMRCVTAPGGGFNNSISHGTTLPGANSRRLGFVRADISGSPPDPMNGFGSVGGPVRIGFRVA